ncbi:unnamed protein product [Notodromas monacha]|uniref:RRM domain-containing protein n=1 Tax=Notodromas monacha TaxID=399045 RepID=A0A7R9GF83_9CRUS|nr:unnamed protein product [Notodromas monacha]CAG0918580.1 unnamed protein product [Notodromas monacha]
MMTAVNQSLLGMPPNAGGLDVNPFIMNNGIGIGQELKLEQQVGSAGKGDCHPVVKAGRHEGENDVGVCLSLLLRVNTISGLCFVLFLLSTSVSDKLRDEMLSRETVLQFSAGGSSTHDVASSEDARGDSIEQSGVLVAGPAGRRELSLVPTLLGQNLAKLSKSQQEAIAKAKKYAMEQSIKMVLMKQTLAHQQQYDIPEAAQLALEQMNGVVIGGRNIKVGRPSNMPQAQSVIEEVIQEARAYNRIYIASVHSDLTEEEIKSVFEAFGRIKSCKLAMTTVPGKHKGYGFIEYDSVQGADEAVSSMNLFDLGGQFLRVGKASSQTLGSAKVGGFGMPMAPGLGAGVLGAHAGAMGLGGLAGSMPGAMGMGIGAMGMGVGGMGGFGGFGRPGAGLLPTPPGMAVIPPPGIAIPTPTGLGAPGIVIPPVSVATTLPVPVALPVIPPVNPAEAIAKAQQEAKMKQQEEIAKKLMENENNDTMSLKQQEDMSIKGQTARQLVMQRLMRTKPESRVVILRNMVGPEDVDDSLQDEISEECSKFGSVSHVIIYNERQGEEEDAEVIVKIFVEFSAPSEAESAKAALNNRYFGGRLVTAELYEQSLFDENDLSG